MKILIVPEIAARESSFVRPGEIQVVGYKEHLEDISRLLDAQDKILAYDEAKERQLFESEFEKPSVASFVGDEYRYIGQVGRPEMVLFIEFVGSWEGWKKCAKSRARSAE